MAEPTMIEPVVAVAEPPIVEPSSDEPKASATNTSNDDRKSAETGTNDRKSAETGTNDRKSADIEIETGRNDTNRLPSITIVMLTTPDRTSFSTSTIDAMERYCLLHGYDFVVHRNTLDPSRSAPWSKIIALKVAMDTSTADWIAWFDDDILITNFNVSLAALIKRQAAIHVDVGASVQTAAVPSEPTNTPRPSVDNRADNNDDDDDDACPDANLIVSEDAQVALGFPMNTGIMAVRRCAWSADFLRHVWQAGEDRNQTHSPWFEQTTITALWREVNPIRQHIRIVPMPELQAFYRYPETLDPDRTVWIGGNFCCHLTGLPNAVRASLVRQMREQGDTPSVPPSFPISFPDMLRQHRLELGRICRGLSADDPTTSSPPHPMISPSSTPPDSPPPLHAPPPSAADSPVVSDLSLAVRS